MAPINGSRKLESLINTAMHDAIGTLERVVSNHNFEYLPFRSPEG